MLNNLLQNLIGTAYAQTSPTGLIPCDDGTMANPSVGCVQTPNAIVSGHSEILSILLKAADAVVTIAVIASVAVMIFGGIVYAMSMGNEEKIKTAKNILFWSIFGLILAILAKYIVGAVLLVIN